MNNDLNYIQILITTLQQQVEVLQQILLVTQQQSLIAESTEFDEAALDDTIANKEVMIAKLNTLDDGFTSVYGRVRNLIRKDQEKYREQLHAMQDLIKQCTDIGIEIRVLEERNRDRLVRCFSERHMKYGAKRTAAAVASRYSKTMNSQKVSSFSYFDNNKKI